MARILLLIFLYNSMGYFFIFKCVQLEIKKQATQTIESPSSSNLTETIAFHKNDLNAINWVEKDAEFLYKGRLYDVSQKTETVDSVIYQCLGDVLEDDLNNYLDDHIKTNVTENTQKHSSKKASLKPVELYFTGGSRLSFNLFSFTFCPPNPSSICYPPVYIEMSAPPPKFS